jgi:pyruvate, orthophosphate dikinase
VSEPELAVEPELYPILADAMLPRGGAKSVGNKAWNLLRLAKAGLAVPAGFVLPTSWCRRQHGGGNDGELRATLRAGITRLEAATGLGFGSARRPLLVSVRSGGAVSMPGMLETVLDVGLNRHSIDGLVRLTGNPRLAWDCFRRLVQGYAEVVTALPTEPFDALLRATLAEEHEGSARELDHRALRTLTLAMLELYQELAGAAFPSDPLEQLTAAAGAVFRSWDAPKAATYRKLNRLDDDAGTAVTVQAMVFGNAGGTSGSGVGFTRNPATGVRELYIDFCRNGQGEDVVAGRQSVSDNEQLRHELPAVYGKLEAVRGELEALFGDAQDFEFTVQDGQLYLLQTRSAKRTDWAALRIAVDMVEEGLITPAAALALLDGIRPDSVVRTTFAAPLPPPLAHATVAGQGVACGPLAMDNPAAARLAALGTPPILVRHDSVTDDIAGMQDAAGILTEAGGRTSHAAVVARQMGKVCLVSCPNLSIALADRRCRIGGTTLVEGDWLALDGNTGEIYPGRLEILAEHPDRELAAIASWRQYTSA